MYKPSGKTEVNDPMTSRPQSDFVTSAPTNVPRKYHHLQGELERNLNEAVDNLDTEYSKRHMHVVLMVFILKNVYPMVTDDEEEVLIEWWIRKCRDPENREPFAGLYEKFNTLINYKQQWKQRLGLEDVPSPLVAAYAIKHLVCALCNELRDEWRRKIPQFVLGMQLADYLKHIESFLRNYVVYAIYLNNDAYPVSTYAPTRYELERSMNRYEFE